MTTRSPTALVLLALAAPMAIAAEPPQIRTAPPASGVMVAPPTPDADALAAEMRVLATNPQDVEALTKAGELTLKLGDPTAAANLFARADKIEPNNGGLKADEASVLVHLERPGEALRMFQQAVAMGADPAHFAAERGLAYDLIGQQERAQRDYRLALQSDPDDAETLRRYALSLGISGKRKEALAEIDPLVRSQDHAGWRDRAFIFAMTGDPDQAQKIASAMLPADMAEGLAPFFERLPGLSPTDKAFAVHFGDLQVTPERLADARMTPPLPALERDPSDEQVAAAAPAPEPVKERKRHERKKKHEEQAPPATMALAENSAPTAPPPARAAPASSPPIPVHVEPVTRTTAPAPTTVAAAPMARATPAPAPQRPVVAAAPRTTAPATTAERPATRIGEEDHILANIMAGIAVPTSESAPPPAAVVAAPAAAMPAVSTAAAAAEKARVLEAQNLAAIRLAVADKAAAQAAAEAKRKAEQDKKEAAAKKAADDKAAAEKRAEEKEEKADPARIWVQVAGGADEDDLPKAWAKVKAKAPEAFKGKTGWTTPLRATNRVLAGPFKSDDAAQDFVNDLAKQGIHAFAFTSDEGQKIDKLPAK